MQIIVLMGPPAAGKGTQAEFFKAEGFFHFSSGNYFRRLGEAGGIDKDIIDSGNLGPDEIIIPKIRSLVDAHIKSGQNLLLDGFPRNLAQAEFLTALLKEKGVALQVVELTADPAELERRRTARVAAALAKGEAPRADDLPERFAHRQNVYRDLTAAMHPYFHNTGVLRVIPPFQTPGETFAAIRRALGWGRKLSGPGFLPS